MKRSKIQKEAHISAPSNKFSFIFSGDPFIRGYHVVVRFYSLLLCWAAGAEIIVLLNKFNSEWPWSNKTSYADDSASQGN